MPTAKKQRQSKALQIACIFGIVVVLLICLSLLVKLGIVASRSRFDNRHQFVLQVQENASTSEIIIFSPDTHRIAIVALTGDHAGVIASKTIQIPIDAIIAQNFSNEKLDALIHRALVGKSQATTLNPLDRLKLLAFSQTVADDDMMIDHIVLPTVAPTVDNTITTIATDQTLYKEGMSIAIVNGSGVSGLGNALAKLLTHIGANVISVTTADTEITHTTLVYTGKKSYTVKRLEEIFNTIGQSTIKAGIADMTLTIGKDKSDIFTPL